jgi:hypothetical protein
MDRQLREWDDDEQAAGAQAANAWHEFFAAQGPPATERAEDVEATAPIVEASRKMRTACCGSTMWWASPRA